MPTRDAVRATLAERGYRIAAVTMSFADYDWNAPYVACLARRDAAAITRLETAYLADARTAALSARDRYKLVGGPGIPRPIALVTSRSAAGHDNAAPFSFFNVMAEEPPIVVLGLGISAAGGAKDTTVNIRDTGEFVVNLVDEPIAEAMNLPADQQGVLIGEVVGDGPAAEAGLRGSTTTVEINGQEVLVGGDVIIAVDGHPIPDMQTLQQFLAQYAPGDEIAVTILRDGEQSEVSVTLGQLPR